MCLSYRRLPAPTCSALEVTCRSTGSSLLTLQLPVCRMPHIGQKRRNSIEATCDSSQCAFCSQRSQVDPAHAQLSFTSDSYASTGASLPNDFSSWLQAQNASNTSHEHIDLRKIGLPLSHVLAGPPSKRNRSSIDICEASSSDSSDPNPATVEKVEESSSVLPMPAIKFQAPSVPWVWSNEWADQPEPRPGTLADLCSFSAPFSSGRAVQHTADIVCGVKFSPDGKFLATAGVAKQVLYRQPTILRTLHLCVVPTVAQLLLTCSSTLCCIRRDIGIQCFVFCIASHLLSKSFPLQALN